MNDLFSKELREWFFQNLANMVTILGFLATIWLLVIAINNPEELWLIMLLAGIVGLSDLIDGIVARKLKITSSYGAALDRLRDKIFVAPILIILTWHHAWKLTNLPSILTTLTTALVIALVTMEIFLFIAWWTGLFTKLILTANKWGKRKMFCEFLAVIFWLISLTIEKYSNFSVIRFSIYLIDLILTVTVFLAAKSLEGYYQSYTKRIQDNDIRKTKKLS